MMLDKFGFKPWVFGAALLLASACDSAGDSDDQAEDDSATGDDDDPGTGDGDRDPTGDGDGDIDSGGDVGGPGELEGCAAHLEASDCLAAPGCTVVYGQPLLDDGEGGWCTGAEAEFIGCADSSDLCPSITKTLCDTDSYWRTDACVPDNLGVCDPPGDLSGAC
jgi:hypothetical protein